MGDEAKYTVLSPRGYIPPFERIPLTAPRLTDLKGKTVYLVDNGAYGVLIDYGIVDALKQTFPETTFVHWNAAFTSWVEALRGFPPPEELSKADAAICGIGW